MHWQHQLILASITLAFGLIFIFNSTSPPDRIRTEAPLGYPERDIAQPRLADETLERGIFFLHAQISDAITGLDEALGSGACAFDFDNDRDMDLYLVGGSGHRRYYGKPSWWSKKRTGRLYRNRGDGHFEDVTDQSGLDVTLWGMGCNAADFDLDGYVDLLVTGRNQNYLWQNMNGNSFRQVAFGDDEHWSTSAAIGDYNADGRMDIYIASYLDYDNTARQFEGSSGYETAHAEFKSKNYSAQANRLLTNRGNFQFDESAAQLGVDNSDGRSLGARWFDFDRDRRIDLLVLNDTGSTTRLYLNQSDTSFIRASLHQRLELPSGIRGGALQDFDGDGDADLVLSTRLGEGAGLLANRQGEFTNVLWQQHADSNLFVGLSGYGVQFVDLNNDGDADIFHANGLAEPEPDAHAVSAGQPDLISLGDGRGNFRPAIPEADQSWALPLSSRTVVSVDVDNDGDRDLLLTANNNPARLLINHAPLARWIGFDLTDRYGNPGNFDSLQVTTSLRQKTWFADADTLLGRHDDRVLQALQADETVDKVSIHWRDGEPTVIEKPALKTYHVVIQGNPERTQYKHQARNLVALPPRLALWQIRAGSAEREASLAGFNAADRNLRLRLIEAIVAHDPQLELLPILKTALEDPDADVVIAAIDALRRLELEASYYWLSRLFQHENPRIQCALANTFRHFYIEEEAMIQRKSLAVPHLLKLLEQEDPRVVTCAALALAESKNYRAVVPIERLLLDRNDRQVLQAAVYALGELRRTRSVDSILSLATDDPALRDARRRALGQLNVTTVSGAVADILEPAFDVEKATTPCPAQSASELMLLAPDSLAAALETCSTSQLRNWFDRNASDLGGYAADLLDNRYLTPENYAATVRALGQDPGFEITKMFVSHLHKHRGIVEDIALMQALEPRLPQRGLEKLLKNLLDDDTNSKQLRIAAGDMLLDIDSDYVMSYADDLFE